MRARVRVSQACRRVNACMRVSWPHAQGTVAPCQREDTWGQAGSDWPSPPQKWLHRKLRTKIKKVSEWRCLVYPESLVFPLRLIFSFHCTNIQIHVLLYGTKLGWHKRHFFFFFFSTTVLCPGLHVFCHLSQPVELQHMGHRGNKSIFLEMGMYNFRARHTDYKRKKCSGR